MTVIKGIVKNGRVEVSTPPEWPEGCEVFIEPVRQGSGKIGLSESEWRDDPQALADWTAWINSIEPLELTSDEEAAFARFDEEMQHFNLEAVRRQMKEESSP